ncbi:MAG TPA: DNA mismatch repair protein MutS [Vicinamibacterales bacterium]|jgi:DNA mismatch repair protein MutS|nr:DNA mismatch repair protein MutS [Vicinamibacterales bacterium]|tara:strand:+ start:24657 stop:27275 length:2619 start_codon:yes stop_codon:yes gene_type:complete
MRQYLDTKQQYSDAVLFFRMGDFYEMFYEDALTAARALDLTLTSRSKDGDGAAIPMCGVPFHSAEGYIARLVTKGFRVAICEQMNSAKKGKGLVKREIVRVVSPGTLIDSDELNSRKPAFLMAIVPKENSKKEPTKTSAQYGVALVDLSTGEFQVAEYQGATAHQQVLDEISVLQPRELVIPDDMEDSALLKHIGETPITRIDSWTFNLERARDTLCSQLHVQDLEGFGLKERLAATAAAGGLISYLRDTQKCDLSHLRELSLREHSQYLSIDPTTFQHLEIIAASDGSSERCLLSTIDQTVTAMGGRQLRSWLVRPLLSIERIQDRLDAVEEFAFDTVTRGKLREVLKGVVDLERLVARVSLATAGPRDLLALHQSAVLLPRIRGILGDLHAPLTLSLLGELDDLSDLRSLIEKTISEDAPAQARDGGCIREGSNSKLDELRSISNSGRQLISEMEAAERTRTGISSLKIRFNRIFGYYIEISKAHLQSVPDDYHRKQTVAGGERFVTPSLKEYEDSILGADERILEQEIALFEALRKQIAEEIPRIQDTARAVSGLDTLSALAEVAVTHEYTKPQIHNGDEFEAYDVRHPVVERYTPERFVPNDLLLNKLSHQLIILTGPNMGGKSTYLRQAALLTILAQTGSFVPARQAKLPLVDRVFARVGASDNIARGHSTFMVEMEETAHILHTATPRSLVLLDEIGRGTATFDGLSIAWAVAEHLATNQSARPHTLFATHYHELTDLAEALPGVINFHVVAREHNDNLVFLRKVVPGRSDRSYGIQVARLAGLPQKVVRRAREILDGLERDELTRAGRPAMSGSNAPSQEQPGLFQGTGPDDQIRQRLRTLDLDQITPLKALDWLAELKRDMSEE